MAKPHRVVTKQQVVQTDILGAIGLTQANLSYWLVELAKPINHSKESQDTIIQKILETLERQADLLLQGMNTRCFHDDFLGFFSNTHVMSVDTQLKKSSILPILITKVINSKEVYQMARQTANAKRAQQTPAPTAAEKEQATVVEAAPTKTPVAEAVEKETTVKTPEPVIIPVSDFNTEFHQPYVLKIEEILDGMNGLLSEDPEFINNRRVLSDTVRSWLEAFYKNIMASAKQEANVDYLTVDVHGLLLENNPFSTPEYMQYDYAYIVGDIIKVATKKYKNTSGDSEVSIWSAATAIINLQDDSQRKVEIPMTSDGKESVLVDKDKGTVEAKQDGFIVRNSKRAWGGVKKMFTSFCNFWKNLWNWCTSWFRSGEKVVISSEEYEKLKAKKAA